MRSLLLASFTLLAACNAPTRTVEGRLMGSLSQAVVFSETSAGTQTAAAGGADGRFSLSVPVGTAVKLVVATPAANGFAPKAHIGPTWFVLKDGPPLNVGIVHTAGTPIVETTGATGGTEPAEHLCPGPAQTSGVAHADLPYDAKLSVGQTWKLSDAFLEKGPAPAKIVSVTMDGSTWHLAELQSDTAFTVTDADCTHAGNRDVGRDRAFITWQNADGTTETDHLDLRYCDGGGSSGGSSGGGDSSADDASGGSSGGGMCHVSDDDTCGGLEVNEGCGATESASCDHLDEMTELEGSTECAPAGGATPPPVGETTPPADGTGAPTPG